MHSLTYFSFLPSPTSCFRGSLRTLGSFMAYASAFPFLSLGVLPFNVAGSDRLFQKKKKSYEVHRKRGCGINQAIEDRKEV